jgi:hypothetical protein
MAPPGPIPPIGGPIIVPDALGVPFTHRWMNG